MKNLTILAALVLSLFLIASASAAIYTISNLSTDANLQNVDCEGGGQYCHLKVNETITLYYPFDVNASSTTEFDWSGYNSTGTFTGSTYINSTARYGTAAQFDGNGDFVATASQPVSALIGPTWAISFWARTNSDSSGYSTPYFCFNPPGFMLINRIISAQGPEGIYIADNTNYQVLTAFPAAAIGVWKHYLLMDNGTDYVTYVNGVFNAKNAITVNPEDYTSNIQFAVGAVPLYGYWYNGSIDEFMIFNRSLSADEIGKIYNGTFPRFYSSGTHDLNVTITSGDNIVNVTASNFNQNGTNLSLKLSHVSGVTSPQNVSSTVKSFAINSTTTNLGVNFTYLADNFSFFSPILNNSVVMATSYVLIPPCAVWLGTTSTNWSIATNWDTGVVPNSTYCVILNGTATNQPVLEQPTLVYNLTVNGTLTLKMPWNSSLNVTENVEILSGGTLTHGDNSNAETYRVNMIVGGNFIILSGGSINVAGLGYDLTSSYGGCIPPLRAGGSYGGMGGGIYGSPACSPYGSVTAPSNLGGGAGDYSAGNGGGAVILNVTGTTTINGAINANATYAGAGGSIFILTSRVLGSGRLSSDTFNNYAGGGGGRIAIILTSGNDFGNLSITAYGSWGNYGGEGGAAGTIYLKKATETYGTLIIDNNNTTPSAGVTTLFSANTTLDGTSQVYTFDNITIRNNGALEVGETGVLNLTNTNITGDGKINSRLILTNVTNLTIPATWSIINLSLSCKGLSQKALSTNLIIGQGGVLTHEDNSNAEIHKINLTIIGNLTILSGGNINVSMLGYDCDSGPGLGGAGSSYGGRGGTSAGWGASGPTYGSVTSPTNLGTGGICSNGPGYGGGAVILNVTDTTTINGTIETSSNYGYYGAGTGGSVFITTSNLLGVGLLNANAGTSYWHGGGGGRIAIILTAGTSFGNINFTAYSTPSIGLGVAGASGTIFLKKANQAYGDLIIDNNNIATSSGITTQLSLNTTFDGASRTYTFDNITIRNKGVLEVTKSSQLNLTNTALTSSGASSSKLSYTGNNLTLPANFNITNLTISQNGTEGITWNTNLVIGPGGVLTHEDNSLGNESHKINLTIVGNLTILSGGQINVTGLGYDAGYGPGTTGFYANGAGYGGLGMYYTDGANKIKGPTYGSLISPTHLGSGGSNSGTSCGGGAIILNVTGTAMINGTAESKGLACNYGGSSGGSIYLIANNLLGSGLITSDGGTSSGGGGAGGGGRISVILTSGTSFDSVNFTAYGGSGGGYAYGGWVQGAAGTIYLKKANQAYGSLIIDNKEQTTEALTSTEIPNNQTWAIGDLNLRGMGVIGVSNISGNVTLYIHGNVSLNKTGSTTEFFYMLNGTVFFNGSNEQFLEVGKNSSFNNLNITNTNKVWLNSSFTTNNLYSEAAGSQIIFTSGANYTVKGTVAAKGNSSTKLVLNSSSTAMWNLNASSNSISYVSARYSNASKGSSIVALSSTDSGNNENWLFPSSALISPVDTLYTNVTSQNFTINVSQTNLANATLTVEDTQNKWLEFDGVDDLVTITDSAILDSPSVSNQITISVWANKKGTSGSWSGIVTRGINTDNFYGIRYYENAFLGLLSSGVNVPIALPDMGVANNYWYNAVLVANDTYAEVFLNGVSKGTSTGTDLLTSISGNNLIIGKLSYTTLYFNGSIDEVRIYNRSLSASEISNIYTSGLTSNPKLTSTGLVAWYDFNEGSGTNLIDRATGVNNGTISGAVYKYQYTSTTTFTNTINTIVGTVVNLVQGVYRWFYGLFDTSGNYYQTENRTLTVDTTLPIVSFASPTPASGANLSQNWVYVNVSSSDTNNLSTFVDFDNSLVGWWRMDDRNASGDVVDYMGRNNGTNVGATYTTAGKLGGAMGFDGVDDDIRVTSNPTLKLINMTISVWSKKLGGTGSGIYETILSKSGTGSGYTTNYQLMHYISGGALSFRVGLGGSSAIDLISPNNYDDGSWHNSVGVAWYDGTSINASLYVDGVLVSTTAALGTPQTGTDSVLTIGKWGMNIEGSASYGFFNGSIDDVMIFNRSLTSQEILALYQSGIRNLNAPVLDQQNTNTIGAGSSMEMTNTKRYAQVFEASRTGVVTNVSLYMYYCYSGNWNLSVCLYNTKSGFRPSTVMYCQNYTGNGADASGFNNFNFNSPQKVVQGTRYAIVFYIYDGNTNFATYFDVSHKYTKGGFYTALDGVNWSKAIPFRTYINNVKDNSADTVGTGGAAYYLNHTAFSFTPTTTGALSNVSFYLYNYDPAQYKIKVELYNSTSDGNLPDSLVANLGNITLNGGYDFYNISQQGTLYSVTAGNTYFLVLTPITLGGVEVEQYFASMSSTQADSFHWASLNANGTGWDSSAAAGDSFAYSDFGFKVNIDPDVNIQYYNNFTNLNDGTHTIKAYSQDAAGNVNSTETRTLVLDITAPTGTLLTPTNNTFTSNQTQNFTINITDTGGAGLKNATLYIEHQSNYWLDFDGVDDWVTTNKAISSLITGSNGTISMWIKPTGNSPAAGASYQASGVIADGGALLGIHRGVVGEDKIWFYNWDGGEDKIGVSYTNENWIYLVWVHGSGNLSAYANGVLVDSINSGNTSNLDGTINLGKSYNNVYFNGSIDEVRIYNRSLSASEISQIYQKELAYSPDIVNSSLVAYYNFNEGSGTTLIDRATGINNGTISGASYSNAETSTTNFASGVVNVVIGVAKTVLEGIYKFFWRIFDFAGNQFQTENQTLVIDTTAPSLVFNSPTPNSGANLSQSWIYVNATASDANNISTFVDFDNSLVGWWRMDDRNSSGDVVDYMGRNNGTVSGAAYTTAGRLGKAMSFDGVNDYILIPHSNSLNITQTITFGGWMYPLSFPGCAGFITKGVAIPYSIYGGSGCGGSANTLKVYFEGLTSGTVWSDAISLNQWHQVMVTYNGSAINFYLDGILNKTQASTGTMVENTQNLAIGSLYGGGSFPFNGSIDDVMIFNRSLSASEISSLYANSSSKYYEKNFTNLNDGTHTIKAYSQDAAGNINSTELRTLTLDTTNPNATLIAPNSSLYSNTSTINFTANISDNLGIKNVTLNIYNSTEGLVNQTTTSYAPGVVNTVIGTVVTIVDGVYHWFYSLFDWAGNQFTTGNNTLTIDTVYPQVQFTSPTPDNSSGRSGFFQANLTISDLYLANISYTFNNTQSRLTDLDKLTQGLVLMMNFNNESSYGENSSSAYDYSGRGNNGTIIGAIWNSSGKYGASLSFDGADDIVRVSNSNTLNIYGTNKPISVSFWFKFLKDQGNKILLHKGTFPTYEADVYCAQSSGSGTCTFAVNDNGAYKELTSGSFSSNNDWHQVTGVYNTTHLIVYIDGVIKSTPLAHSGIVSQDTYDLVIGSYGPDVATYAFNGSIDEVRIWNRSLSASEISQLYYSQLRNYPGSGKIYLENYNGTADSSKNSTLMLTRENSTLWNLLINQSGMNAGSSYLYSISASDLAGNVNQTETRVIRGNAAPSFNSISYSPSSLSVLDPGVEITILANLSDTENNFESAVLQWRNSTSAFGINNITMTNRTAIATSWIMNASFFLPSYQDNITFRVVANDTLGEAGASSNSTLVSYWDCFWTYNTDLSSVAGWSQNKKIGEIIINNTGDIEHSNSNCSLDFRFSYDLTEGRVYFDNSYYKPSSVYTITAGSNRTIAVNATFATEIKQENVNLTISEVSSRSNQSSLNLTSVLVTNQNGPYLYEKATSYPTSVYLTAGTFSLQGYVRNLMGSTVVNESNTAYNVTFYWQLPTGLALSSGNLTQDYGNITDSDLHYIDTNITFSDLASMTSGIQTINLKAYGYNLPGSRIVDANNQTTLSEAVSINFLCYNISDSVLVTACGSLDGDYVAPTTTTTTTTITAAGGSSGGGGLGGESFGKYIREQQDFELVRGKQNSFVVEFVNPYLYELRDLQISLTGIMAGYVDISPKTASSLAGKETLKITAKITAPSYFNDGTYELELNIDAKIKKNISSEPFNAKKKITLRIYGVSGDEANVELKETSSWIEEMKKAGLISREIESLLEEMNKQLGLRDLGKVDEKYKEAKKIYDSALESKQLIEEMNKQLKEAESNGIGVAETKKMLGLAEAAFSRGDYISALERIKEAQLSYALETKGEFNLAYYVKNNPVQSGGIVLALAVLSFGSSLVIRRILLKEKIKVLNEEEKLLIGLMKVVQTQCFEEGKMGMDEYETTMIQYESRLNMVIQDRLGAETKLANLMKLSGGKRKALKQEEIRLKEIMRDAQKLYFEKAGVETRIYENMMKSYAAKLSEVEEELATMDAKEALRKKGFKWRGK